METFECGSCGFAESLSHLRSMLPDVFQSCDPRLLTRTPLRQRKLSRSSGCVNRLQRLLPTRTTFREFIESTNFSL